MPVFFFAVPVAFFAAVVDFFVDFSVDPPSENAATTLFHNRGLANYLLLLISQFDGGFGSRPRQHVPHSFGGGMIAYMCDIDLGIAYLTRSLL